MLKESQNLDKKGQNASKIIWKCGWAAPRSHGLDPRDTAASSHVTGTKGEAADRQGEKAAMIARCL